MATWALAWCLQHPAVTCVIPGCKSVDRQVEANAKGGRARPGAGRPSAGGGRRTLTLTVGAGAAEGSADLTVTGTAGTLTTEAELTLDIDSLTVTGRVEGALRRPVIGATIASQGETAFTDASGAFTLTGLALPYDLVVSAGIDDGVLHVYEGLTSPTPLVRPTFAAFATPSTAFDATVDGLFTGGALGANEVVVVCVEGLAVAVYGCTTRDAPDTDYSLSAFWFDGATASVRLHALHMEVDAEGVPTAYLGYETIELNLADGAVVLADLDFDPVASDNLTGTTSHPVALPDSNMLVLARFGPNLSVPLAELSDPADSFSVLVPVLPGLSYDVLFGAGTSGSSTLGWKRDVGLDAGAFTATVPAAALAPADGATGVELGTPFSSTSDGGARTYVWAPDGAGPFIALTTRPSTAPSASRARASPSPTPSSAASPSPPAPRAAFLDALRRVADVDLDATEDPAVYREAARSRRDVGRFGGPGLVAHEGHPAPRRSRVGSTPDAGTQPLNAARVRPRASSRSPRRPRPARRAPKGTRPAGSPTRRATPGRRG
jgi:hypothetical protein